MRHWRNRHWESVIGKASLIVIWLRRHSLVPRLCLGMQLRGSASYVKGFLVSQWESLKYEKFPTFSYRRQSLRVCIPRQSLGTRGALLEKSH